MLLAAARRRWEPVVARTSVLIASAAAHVLMSAVALVWNYLFNGWFERWEARQATRGRSWRRRLLHGLGFEGGLVVLLVPVMAWWLDTSLLQAFVADLGVLMFFFVYAVVFTWAFDRVFGLPLSAQPAATGDTPVTAA